MITLNVRVVPRARKTECAFFSSALHVPRRAVHILSGERGRRKRVAIEGVTPEQIRALTT